MATTTTTAAAEELAGVARELKETVAGRFDGLDRRLRRLEAGPGYVPPDLHESGAAAARAGAGINVERGGFARWLRQTLVEGGADATKGPTLVPAEQADEIFELLGAASIGLLSGFTQVPCSSDELHLPTVRDDSASWVAEATAIPAAEPTLGEVVARPRKLGAYVDLSSELIADSSPAALQVVSDSVVRAMARKLDAGFFVGSGTAPEIRGLFNIAGIQMIPTVGALTSLDPFINAFALLEAADLTPTAIYMAPGAWADLMAIKEATGSAVPVLASAGGVGAAATRSLLGTPVFISSQMPLDKIGVAQASQVLAVRRQEASVAVSTDVGFETDTVALRCLSRWDVVLPNVKAFVALTGVTGVTLMATQAEPEATASKTK